MYRAHRIMGHCVGNSMPSVRLQN